MRNPAKVLLERSIQKSIEQIPSGHTVYESRDGVVAYVADKDSESVRLQSAAKHNLGVEKKKVVLNGDFSEQSNVETVSLNIIGAIRSVTIHGDSLPCGVMDTVGTYAYIQKPLSISGRVQELTLLQLSQIALELRGATSLLFASQADPQHRQAS